MKQKLSRLALAIVGDTQRKINELLAEEEAIKKEFEKFGRDYLREMIKHIQGEKLKCSKKYINEWAKDNVDNLISGTSVLVDLDELFGGKLDYRKAMKTSRYGQLLKRRNDVWIKINEAKYLRNVSINGKTETVNLALYDSVLKFLIAQEEQQKEPVEKITDEAILKEALEILKKAKQG